MAKLVISHASEDLAVVKRFVALLEDGLGLTRDDLVCSSLPGYGFRLGSPFRDDIRDHVATADAVLALVSPAFMASPYCMGEVGIAWGLKRPIIPLLLPNISTTKVRGPMSGLDLARLAQIDTLDRLWEAFGVRNGRSDLYRWQDRRNQFLANVHLDVTNPEVLPDRGFWSGRIVDGTLHIGSEVKTQKLRVQTLDALENGRPVPPHLFYVTDLGTERWLALAEDPSFVAYQDSMALVWSAAATIADAVVEEAGSTNIDFVSLGPGDGRKDVALLVALVQARGGGDIIYYPFDISINMIAKTVERARADKDLCSGLAQVKAVVADFDSLPVFRPIYQYREGPNLLTLLGNMLGNVYDDFGFLRRLHDRAMLTGDLLLVEVRLQSEESRTSLREMERTDWPLSNRFDFGPLELLGIDFDADRLYYSFEPDRGTIRGSNTIVARYAEASVRGRVFRDIDLSYVHRYEQQTFLREVARAGFHVVRTWQSPRQHNLWVLAKKTARTPG